MLKKTDKNTTTYNNFFLSSEQPQKIKVKLVSDESAKPIFFQANYFNVSFGDCACSVPIKNIVREKTKSSSKKR